MALAERQAKSTVRENNVLRNQLIHENLPYVKRIVHRIATHLPSSVDIDDLMNAGIIGLIEAIERYDPTRDNKFITYAVFRIKGAVLSELRSQDFLSRSARRKLRELENAFVRLEQKLGREVDDEEVATEMNLSLDKFYQIKRMASISFVSFDDIGCSTKEEKEHLMNFLMSNENKDALAITRLKEIEAGVAKAIDQLSKKEKLVISLYYWDEMTMKEIGRVLEITESRVSQIHAQAIMHLRVILKKEGLINS